MGLEVFGLGVRDQAIGLRLAQVWGLGFIRVKGLWCAACSCRVAPLPRGLVGRAPEDQLVCSRDVLPEFGRHRKIWKVRFRPPDSSGAIFLVPLKVDMLATTEDLFLVFSSVGHNIL